MVFSRLLGSSSRSGASWERSTSTERNRAMTTRFASERSRLVEEILVGAAPRPVPEPVARALTTLDAARPGR